MGRNSVNVIFKSLSLSILSILDSAKCVIPRDFIVETMRSSPATHFTTGSSESVYVQVMSEVLWHCIVFLIS